MTVVFLPGFARHPEQLAGWVDLLPGDVRVMSLPREVTVEAMADAIAKDLPDDALIVGESLGGLIALALGTRGYRAMAFDPPLTLKKQGWLHFNAGLIRTKYPAHRVAVDGILANVFGMMPDGSLEERDYYPLVASLRAPADIVAGHYLCAIDDADAELLSHFPMVRFHKISGGHALLTENVEACKALILDAIQAA